MGAEMAPATVEGPMGAGPPADQPLPRNRVVLLLVVIASAVLLLLVSALVVGRWRVLLALDATVARLFYGLVYPEPALGTGIELWTDVFGPWPMRVLSVLVALWLLARRRVSTALWALTALVVANGAGLAAKFAIDRTRPEFPDPISTAITPAFPSGHALMATVGMGVLVFAVLPLLRGPWRAVLWIGAASVVLVTAGTRPALGVHWVSDTVAGIALGVLVLAGTLLLWTFLPRTPTPPRAARARRAGGRDRSSNGLY